MMIEDQTFPKRCGDFEGKKVIPAEEMVVKIKAACEARRSDDFVIIACTDSRAVHGLDDAIERALMYCEAGADHDLRRSCPQSGRDGAHAYPLMKKEGSLLVRW